MQPHYETRKTRSGRFSEPGRIYLITAVTRDRESFFSDWKTAALMARQLERIDRDGFAATLAWVVMPDHIHWLVQLKERPLNQVIARAKSTGNHAVTKALLRSGSIWQRGFHDRAIRREDDLKAVARYIVLNPVRAGLVKRVGDYPFWNAIWI
jgi:REP element-mobilizing transposase RayT